MRAGSVGSINKDPQERAVNPDKAAGRPRKAGTPMRNLLLKLVNPLMLLLLLFQLLTAILRPGNYRFFSNWHPAGGYSLVVLGLLHLLLNWRWVKAAYARKT